MFREELTCQLSASRFATILKHQTKTYSSGKTGCERDPGNEPRHYSSPIRAVSVVAIATAWIVHGVDIVRLLVYDPIVGQQDAGDRSKLGCISSRVSGMKGLPWYSYPYDIAIHEVKQCRGRRQDVPGRQGPCANECDHVRSPSKIDVLYCISKSFLGCIDRHVLLGTWHSDHSRPRCNWQRCSTQAVPK